MLELGFNFHLVRRILSRRIFSQDELDGKRPVDKPNQIRSKFCGFSRKYLAFVSVDWAESI